MADNPGFYTTGRTLSVKLSGPASAKLSTFRRQEQPGMTDEEAAAYLVEDSLVRLGLLELPKGNRGKMAGKR